MKLGLLNRLVRKFRLITGFLLFSATILAQESVELSLNKPDAIVDLRTKEGVGYVKGEWRYSDAQIIDKDFNAPGASAEDKLALYPTGKSIRTHDIFPKAGAKDFDDSRWQRIDASSSSLESRRGTGLLSFSWYRINVTLPEKLGDFSVEGSTVVFEIVMDDYAEIVVDGQLQKYTGQAGGNVAKGWNARNRVILTKDAKA
jgi:gluconolactonase